MSDALQVFVMEFLKSMIVVVVPVLTTAAIALVYQAARYVRSKLKAEQLAQIDALVAIAVKAAEQSGIIHVIADETKVKKAWALSEAQRLLDERGLKGISVATLDSMIEAAIRDGVHKGNDAIILPPLKWPQDNIPMPTSGDTRPMPPVGGSTLH